MLYTSTTCEVIKNGTTIRVYCYNLPCQDVLYLLQNTLKLTPSHKVSCSGHMKSNSGTWLNGLFAFDKNSMSVKATVPQTDSTEMKLVDCSYSADWLYYGTIIFDV